MYFTFVYYYETGEILISFWKHCPESTELLYCVIDFICVCAYFCDFDSGVTPVPMATCTRQEQFTHNTARIYKNLPLQHLRVSQLN